MKLFRILPVLLAAVALAFAAVPVPAAEEPVAASVPVALEASPAAASAAVEAVGESVERLLAEGRLDEAVAACAEAEAAQGTTAATAENWLALADAMWNAGEREGAGMVLERLSAEEWPGEVRARAKAASEAHDGQWAAMSESGGETTEQEPLGQRIAESLMARGWPVEGAIVAISLLPIVELRGAIPVGHVLIPDENPDTHVGAEDWRRAGKVFLWAVVGNMLPIPFILLLLGPLTRLAMKCRLGKRFFDWLFARTRRKTADIEKYGFWGLAIFVAVPLPVTGAWTGAMAAWLLGIRPLAAFVSILLGVLVAGCIMTALSLMGWTGLIIASAALVVLFGAGIWRSVRKK